MDTTHTAPKENAMKIETVSEQLIKLNEILMMSYTLMTETLRLRKQFPSHSTPIDSDMKKALEKVEDAMNILTSAIGKMEGK
jgi:hypothetical protein